MTTPAHLGGHQQMTWIDRPVLDYLIRRYGIRTMLDVGCGPGGMLDLARLLGIIATGIDGDQRVARPGVAIHDYTTGPLAWPAVDLVWSVEFVEHVDARYTDNFLATFAAGRVLFMTAAYPGQGGHHHVNEQPDTYWRTLLGRHGWTVDDEATVWVRTHGATPFARMTGLVFVRS